MAMFNQELLNVAREKLYNLKNLQHFENVNYLWYDFDQEPNFKQVFQRIRETKFKSNDVISLGFPRSGSHWVFEILHMVLNQKLDFAEDMMFANALEAMTTCHYRQKSEEVPKIYTGHLTLDKLPKDFMKKEVKVVYILRNPKDALLSFYQLLKRYKDPRIRFDMSWDEFFELQLTGEIPWGGWFDHVLNTEAFMKNHPTCQVFVLQYEKIKKNPVKEIKELCNFLNKPKDLAQEIAEMTSFSVMKEGTKEKMSELVNSYWKDGWHFLNKGKVRGWKNTFTVEQNERFNEYFEKVCKGSELAKRVRKYIM